MSIAFTCVIDGRNSYMRTPLSSSSPYKRRPASRTRRWSVHAPGTTTRTSTPRRAARANERRRARSGRKYGVLMAMSDTAPSISIWNTTREDVARSDGELLTSMASVRPAASRRWGHSRGEVTISPQHSSQFSAKTPWRAVTIGPSIRTIVSRHAGRSSTGLSHQSATPAPPVKATRPSTMSSSRCVRLLRRFSVYQAMGWYQYASPPARRSPAK